MHKPEERLNGLRISVLLFATFLRHSLSRWITPLNAFWISLVGKKTSTFWHLKEVSFGGKRLFVSRSWILPGSLGAELPRCCWVNPPGPGWVGSTRAPWHSAVTDDSAARHTASLRNTAQRRLALTQSHASSCRSPLMWLWQENNFQNVLRPQAPLK